MKKKERKKALFLRSQQVTVERVLGDFPDGPVAKSSRSPCRGPGSMPGQGTRSLMPQLRVCLSQLKPSTTK